MRMVSEYKIRAMCPHGVHVIHCDDRSQAGFCAPSWEELRCNKCYADKPDHKVQIDDKWYEIKEE